MESPLQAPCPKHLRQEQYGVLLLEFRQVYSVCARPPVFWQPVVDFFKDAMQAAWQGYMESTCTCYDKVTLRMGASWVSDPADLGNPAEVDNPEDYLDRFFSSRN